FPDFAVEENGESIEGKLSVAIENEELCSRFMTRLVTDVTVGPSPMWLQNCLRNSGIRPTNNVVDVTNFIMLELGQPMHAYDYDHLKGHQLTARLAKEGETIQTLDGTDRELTTDMLVIADSERPVGVAGVMGGFDSEVTNETTTVVFESAVFKGSSIRRTAKALGMRSEASGRYERGVNAEFSAIALDKAAQMLQKICPGAQVAKGVIDVYPIQQEVVKISFTADQVNAYLGTSIPQERMEDILTSLEFGLEKEGDTITATVPSWRNDCTVMPDIAEEVGRIFGYDNIDASIPRAVLRSGSMTPKKALEKEVKHFLASAGAAEIITFSFMHKDGLSNMMLPESDSRYTAIPILNPISEEFPYMRTTLVPAVIEAAIRNLKQKNQDLYLFEVGNVYEPKALPLTEVPHERPMLTGLAINKKTEATWNQAARSFDFYDIKGTVDALLHSLGLKDWDVRRST
ncbi:MAG: phenylalanine--tRNA ligase subunit beta, partial [Veillonella sp.]|nr:phenylalanine--tRNA ligase subunit beta [Veillonella sp.]